MDKFVRFLTSRSRVKTCAWQRTFFSDIPPYPMLFFSISSTRLREPPYLSSRQASTRLNTETPVVKLANDLYLDRLFVKIRLRIYTWTDYPYDGWSVSSINRAILTIPRPDKYCIKVMICQRGRRLWILQRGFLILKKVCTFFAFNGK